MLQASPTDRAGSLRDAAPSYTLVRIRHLHWLDNVESDFDCNGTHAGVSLSRSDDWNSRGLLTFEKGSNYSLIFTQIALTNILLPTVEGGPDRQAHSLNSTVGTTTYADPPILGSIVWFETIGNITISNWSNSGSTAPIPAGFGTLMFNSSEDHIQVYMVHPELLTRCCFDSTCNRQAMMS